MCDTPAGGACLAGWEHPGQQHLPDDRRLFEALWSVDPAVVRAAAEIGVALAHHQEPDLPGVAALADLLDGRPVGDPTAALGRATALTNRIVAYLHAPPRGPATGDPGGAAVSPRPDGRRSEP